MKQKFNHHKKSTYIFTFLILVSVLLFSACNLALTSDTSNVSVTYVYQTQTPQAFNSDANPTQNQQVNQSSERPTPTTIPTKPAPTTKSNANSVNMQLSVGNISFSPDVIVYYGNCNNGETTSIHVEATVDPLDQVKDALLWYEISNQTGVADSGFVNMWQLGIGDYAGDIDIGKIGPNALGNWDGWVDFWIEVVDKNNASIHSNVFSLTIWSCKASLPAPVSPPTINYFVGPGQVKAGDPVTLEWNVVDATCGVVLDGNFVSPSDTYTYQTSAADNGKTNTHTLYAHGEPCDQPNTVTESLDVTITTAQAGQKPNAPTNFEYTGAKGDFSELYFAFKDNSTNEDGFHVYYNNVKSNLSANTSTFTLSPPPCNANWEVYVTAYNTAGESSPSEKLGVDGTCAPGAPKNLFILEWDQFGGAHLHFDEGSGFFDAFIAYVDGGIFFNLDQSDRAYVLDVPCGESWDTYVTAWSGTFGESPPSNTVTVQGKCP